MGRVKSGEGMKRGSSEGKGKEGKEGEERKGGRAGGRREGSKSDVSLLNSPPHLHLLQR